MLPAALFALLSRSTALRIPRGSPLDGPRVGQQVEGHGSEIKADFARLAEHVHAEMAVVELVAHRLGVDTRGTKRRFKTSDTEVHFRELDDVALVRAADLRDLLFAFGPALFQQRCEVIGEARPQLRAGLFPAVPLEIQ